MSDNTALYSSPRAVVDFHRLVDVDDDELLKSLPLDLLKTPISLSSSLQVVFPSPFVEDEEADDCSTDLPPSLRCLSVSTRSSSASATTGSNADDEEDDASESSSVSSVSLDGFPQLDTLAEGPQETPQASPQRPVKRVIFGTYWEKKGGRPKQPQYAPEASEEAEPSKTSVLDKQRSYEDLLDSSEASAAPSRPAGNANTTNSPRRKLWDNHYVSQYQSETALYQAAAHFANADALRKTQSTPVVGPSRQRAGRRPSCLRQSPRFSGSSSRRASTVSMMSSSSSHSSQEQQQRKSSEGTTTNVSFSDHVEVKYVKANTENFAAPGWSKHFM